MDLVAEMEGLKRKLTNQMSPTNPSLQAPWDIGECAGMFWRPNFDTLFYPYLPTHVTKPKECKKLFVVPLADKGMFAVPANSRLVAVPLYELYDNMARYGPVISSIPILLSRYRFVGTQTNLAAVPPVGGMQQAAAQQREQQQQQQQQTPEQHQPKLQRVH
ncbi:nucleotide hydrolase-domain-containing protein [Dunaliella salina]|uniref:Nucleotide hydrolase-domain-containing protein n=1 Tax=Dunaliella salina TaxID=3046 RepID=A0ABQ7G5W4_DUNSA|nr:nucleotide hydrolase-domain-containing protein [Dunaliella salina]|eukprot:KAF5829988.1 nucleotide hydrolase-domain-containing protein [Dunaliella salina]